MNQKQLECFIQLAENLNFCETAELLYITQPAVTYQIKTLEEELQLKLFIRNKRLVELTPAGLSFYNDVKDILTQMNIAVSKARNYAVAFKLNLSIGYEGHLLEMNVLPQILKKYQMKMTHVHLYLKNANQIERKNSLLSNKFDLILTVKDSVKNSSEILFTPLLQSRFVCVMLSSHKLAHNTLISIDNLQNEALILLDPIRCPIEMAKVQESIQLLCPNATRYYSDSSSITYTMIQGGLGIAVMPRFVCPADSDLTIVPLDIPDRVTYGIAILKSNKRIEVTKFIAIIENVFQALEKE